MPIYFQSKPLSSALLLMLSMVFFSSCSHPTEALTVIPTDARMVTSIDVFSLARKGKLYNLSNYSFYQAIEKEIENEGKKTSTLFTNIIEDPTYTGIKLTANMYVFQSVPETGENDRMYGKPSFTCYSAELSDSDDFSKFMKELVEAAEMNKGILTSDKGYDYVDMGPAIIGWDFDKVLLVTGGYFSADGVKREFDRLFQLEKNQQITTIEQFNEFSKTTKDVSMWYPMGEMLKEMDATEIDEVFDRGMLKDLFFSLHLDFQEDAISMTTHTNMNDSIQTLVDESHWDDKDFNDDLLKYFPSKHLAAGSMAVDFNAYYDMMKEGKTIQKMEKGFREQTGMDLSEFIEIFDGSIAMSLFDFKEIEYSYMGYGYGFNEDQAIHLSQQVPLKELGYFSSEDLESLNRGEQIVCKDYFGETSVNMEKELYAEGERYSINIKDILADGGTIEDAIESNMMVDVYKGGWDYGRNKEVTETMMTPLVSFSADIHDAEKLRAFMEKFMHNETIKVGNHYEMDIDGSKSYYAFKDNIFYLTNDQEALQQFEGDGYSDNLGESDLASDLEDHTGYGYVSLNLKDYPEEYMGAGMRMMFGPVVDAIDSAVDNLEFTVEDANNGELMLNLVEKDQNSLFTILKTIDALYASQLNL